MMFEFVNSEDELSLPKRRGQRSGKLCYGTAPPANVGHNAASVTPTMTYSKTDLTISFFFGSHLI